MKRNYHWLLRMLLFQAIIFSGLEKMFSYIILNNAYTLENNPFPRLMIQSTGLLAGHIIGFALSVILMYFIYSISIELNCPLTILGGAIILALAFSMYFSVFLYNTRNLGTLETAKQLIDVVERAK